MKENDLDEILNTHLIDPLFLRHDDFDGFIRDRACRLLDQVEKMIGKSIVGRDAENVIDAFGSSLETKN